MIYIKQYIKPLVRRILEHHESYRWSLQGFGMLRMYVTNELRLHIWNSKFAIKDVSTIHDHPWHFESHVVTGQVVNTRYQVHPCAHDAMLVEDLRIRVPFLKERIVCGPGGGVDKTMAMTMNGERVWLVPREPETYDAGDSYRQQAEEVHHTWAENGTVTLVYRNFLPDTEHAHVFYKADTSWVSAEPRAAAPREVAAIVAHALDRF